jgi:YD repeat-containing protein
VALSSSGENLFVANAEESVITKWIYGVGPAAPPEPPNVGANALTTIDYHVPISGEGAPYGLGSKEAEAWGQTDDPAEATAIFPPDEPMGWPAKDYRRASVYYLDGKGRTVNVASPSGGIATAEYDASNDVVRSLSADNRQAALQEGSKSKEKAALLDEESTYSSDGTQLLTVLGPQHKVKLAQGKEKAGEEVLARAYDRLFYNEGAPVEGGPYDLVTKSTSAAQTASKEEFDKRETASSYSGQEGLGWKLRQATSITSDPSGLALVHGALFDGNGNAVETKAPAGNNTQTIDYSAGENSEHPACGGHAEWAGLACQTQPSSQPETPGLPKLPVTTYTYNIWFEPESTTETVSSTTRTTTNTYDAAGRLKTSSTSSTVGTPLPTVTDEYSAVTGALEKQSTTVEGLTKTLTVVENKLGELTSYTDADGNTATYEYDIDGRPEKTNDGKATQTLGYDTTTGFPSKLVDSAAGTFTASADVEGNVLTEGYPNGMTANYTLDATGTPTGLEYRKTTHCTEACMWFSDTVSPSIHGEWLSQTSTLSSQAYKFDAAHRLTQVQNTPAGEGCTTRLYTVDKETDRTKLVTRPPNAKGECATEGGTTEEHGYDPADRLTDAGVSYDAFGDITALPAADAGGSALTSAFYVNNRLQRQTQNGETIGYSLDPGGRPRETIATGTTSEDIISHYANSGQGPAWTETWRGIGRAIYQASTEDLLQSRTAAKHQCLSSRISTVTLLGRHRSAKLKQNCSRPPTQASSGCRPQARQRNTRGSVGKACRRNSRPASWRWGCAPMSRSSDATCSPTRSPVARSTPIRIRSEIP